MLVGYAAKNQRLREVVVAFTGGGAGEANGIAKTQFSSPIHDSTVVAGVALLRPCLHVCFLTHKLRCLAC